MKNTARILAIILLSVSEYSYSCRGKVERVQLTGRGAVQVIAPDIYKKESGEGDSVGHTICNMSENWKGVTPETCQGWYALILSSLAQDKKIMMQITSCTQAAWSNANPPHMISNYN